MITLCHTEIQSGSNDVAAGAMELLSYRGNTHALQTLVAARYQRVHIATPLFHMGTDNATAQFTSLSPLQKVPVLTTPHGHLNEPVAILRHVGRLRADTALAGKTFFDEALVDQWIEFAKQELDLPVGMWVYPILGFIASDGANTASAKADLARALAVLDAHLASRTHIVGDAVTIADIAIACSLLNPFKLVFDAAFLEPLPNVVRWFRMCVSQPEFVSVLGTTHLLVDGGEASKALAPPATSAPTGKAAKKGKGEGKGEGKSKGEATGEAKVKAKEPEPKKQSKAPQKEPAPEDKLRKKVIKEGGKKGVEIEGASDMGGKSAPLLTQRAPGRCR